MSDDLTKVLLWKNDLTYETVGFIEEENNNVFPKNYSVKSVNNMNIKILNYIKDHQKSEKMDLFKKDAYNYDLLKEDDINSYIVEYMRWRRCSAYLVIQISARGHRYLCYFVDKKYHGAQCFGTSYDCVSYGDIVNQFNTNVSVLSSSRLKGAEDLKCVVNSIKNYNSDIKEHFGI